MPNDHAQRQPTMHTCDHMRPHMTCPLSIKIKTDAELVASVTKVFPFDVCW